MHRLWMVWLCCGTIFWCCPAESLDLRLSWSDDLLQLHSPDLPGSPIEVRYLEAFCRSGSTHRKWEETVIPHTTELVKASPDGRSLQLVSHVAPSVRVEHRMRVDEAGVALEVTLTNTGSEAADLSWAQPCIRVAGFTGGDQESYVRKCFLFTEAGPRFLPDLPRTEEALYRGGQIYVPVGVDKEDVNPRPISPVTPVPPLIGCVSSDDRWLLATAWSATQELFQGVITCIHSDFRIGGLEPGEVKQVIGRIYVLPNDLEALARRYQKDFEGLGEVRVQAVKP